MTNSIHLELASPEKLVMNKPVAMVMIPGTVAPFGVLPGHAPLMSGMVPGVVSVFEKDDASPSASYFVTGGFTEVTQSRCTVLADSIIPVSALNKDEVEAEMAAIDEDLQKADSEDERDAVEKRRILARAKMNALSK